MTTKFLLAGVSAAVALIAGNASASILLSDNFDAGSPHADQLNWTGDATFNVTSPPSSVDLIGAGGSFDFIPGHGGYIDLDGSSGSGNNPAGQLTSVATFGPGTYTVTFDLAGNQRGASSQSTTVSLGSFSQTFGPLASSVGFATQTITFSTASAGHLVFTETGPSDQQGNLLDNVALSVPEPATWAMMLMGFGGLGGVLRHRRRQLAFA
jgi:hypothetical protein